MRTRSQPGETLDPLAEATEASLVREGCLARRAAAPLRRPSQAICFHQAVGCLTPRRRPSSTDEMPFFAVTTGEWLLSGPLEIARRGRCLLLAPILWPRTKCGKRPLRHACTRDATLNPTVTRVRTYIHGQRPMVLLVERRHDRVPVPPIPDRCRAGPTSAGRTKWRKEPHRTGNSISFRRGASGIHRGIGMQSSDN